MKRIFFAASLALFAVACHDGSAVDHVDVVPLGAPPLGTFTTNNAAVPVGIVAAFDAHPKNYANSLLSATISAASDEGDVLEVVPTTTANEFIVIGLKPGDSTVRLYAQGREVHTIPVTVPAQ